jgi:hypothetical protein
MLGYLGYGVREDKRVGRHHGRTLHHHLFDDQDRGGAQEEVIYRNYGKLDDQVLQDGDASFRGINTYLEPCSSETGASD